MTQQELAKLIQDFTEAHKPTPDRWGSPTVDETIQIEPYWVLERFALFLLGDGV